MAEGHTKDSLGYIHLRLGQPARAITSYRKAIDIFRQLDDRYDEGRVLTHLGDAHRDTGDIVAAQQTWQDALALLDDLDHPEGDQLRAKIEQIRPGSV